jgi:hypothetical protein
MLDRPATFRVVTLLAMAANAFPGVAALARAGVPESWLTFPIGTLKTAGAVGLPSQRQGSPACLCRAPARVAAVPRPVALLHALENSSSKPWRSSLDVQEANA